MVGWSDPVWEWMLSVEPGHSFVNSSGCHLQCLESSQCPEFLQKLRIPLGEKPLDSGIREEALDVAVCRVQVQGILAELILKPAQLPFQRLHLLFHPGDKLGPRRFNR